MERFDLDACCEIASPAAATSARRGASGESPANCIDSMNAVPPLRPLPHRPRRHPICLWHQTFGEQVGEAEAYAILDHALERGVNFIDTADVLLGCPPGETFGATESIIGSWFARPGARQGTGHQGGGAGAAWTGSARAAPTSARPTSSAPATTASKRLRTEVIDLHQIHWPARNVANPRRDLLRSVQRPRVSSIRIPARGAGHAGEGGQGALHWACPTIAHGVAEFVAQAEAHGLPRVATVQNPYALTSARSTTGSTRVMHRLQVSLLATRRSPSARSPASTTRWACTAARGPGAWRCSRR